MGFNRILRISFFLLLAWVPLRGSWVQAAPVAAAPSPICIPETLKRLLEPKFADRLARRKEAEALAEQRKQNREEQELRAALNQEKRIDFALSRLRDPAAFKPSELRELKSTLASMTEKGMPEATALERRIAQQEAKFSPKKPASPLTPEQAALIERNVVVTPLAQKQLGDLPAHVVQHFLNKISLDLAQNPRNMGVPFQGRTLIEGTPRAHFKKIRFSFRTEYRVIFRIDADGKAIVEAIGTREGIYKGKFRDLGGSGG